MNIDKTAWDNLTLPEQAAMMKVAVNHGIYNLQEIKAKYNEYAMGGDKDDDEQQKSIPSLSEAKRLGVLIGAVPFARPKTYIGGNREQTWDKYWQTDTEMNMLTDSIAKSYDINPDLLRYRLNHEGYTDARVKEINKDYKNGTNNALLGEALFKSPAPPKAASDEFGLDDTATYINNGSVGLINESWGDGDFINEHGRVTNIAIGDKYSDNMGIMAATLKYFRDLARKDFPNASEADLDRYAVAYYNRGPKGGKDWVKQGAKGYNIKRYGGPLIEAFENEMAEGGRIYIKPSHRGRLTELKKRTGKTEAELYNDGNPAHKRMVVFARNSRKWKHGEGGNLFAEAGQLGHPYYEYDDNGNLILGADGKPLLTYNAKTPLREVVITGKKNKGFLEEALDRFKDVNLAYVDNPAIMTAAGQTSKISETHYPTKEEQQLADNLAVIGAAGSTPFAVTAAPAVSQGITTLLTNPYFDAATTSLGGAHGIQSITDGEADWMTALELAPMARLAKPVYNIAVGGTGKALNFINSPITGNWTTFGNKQYRFKPGYLGANSTPIESRPLFTESYEIENLPGYQLRGLMRGNPLEKQLSKSGTISVKSIEAQTAKSNNVEKEVINKVLSSDQFAGQKAIDYNAFRKAVQDELVTYDRIPSVSYENYGANRIGFDLKAIYRNVETESRRLYNELMAREHDFVLQHGRRPMLTRINRNDPSFREAQRAWDAQFGEEWQEIQNAWNNFYNTHPRFSNVPGNSDWTELVGYEGDRANFSTFTFESPRMPFGSNKHYNKTTLGHSRTFTTNEEPEILHVMESQSDWGQQPIFENGFVSKVSTYDDPFNILHNKTKMLPDNAPGSAQIKYLHDNYIPRQIQENLRWAAEHGQSKMRYPTPETATKIEGYSKELTEKPQIQTILKKYADFPKIYGKLYKGSKIRTITDAKGNTWYEVDVPENYLNQEWQYELGGYFKNGLKI